MATIFNCRINDIWWDVRIIKHYHHLGDVTIPQCMYDAQVDDAFLLETLNLKEMSMNASIHVKSIAAAREYGKVVASPARLNMGDCFVYAVAKEYRLPLLFKGDDFTKPILSGHKAR
ncbi:hypothetical protein [Agrobacterium sp. Azo12]|uniref:hypothetical protein n=1 Tax=Agrobacterium sp. Azo12 TaxID=3031129 RepID=UPI0023D7EF5B|nr:hypothetical protein [Agrobacterium sp. Azo12]MDO5898178.1 hypothetical protein [Agrobacterium sp. Azo12]